MTQETVAAVIPTKNVAHIIKPTLDALQFCDEVVIVDMFSTDETRQLCEAYPNVYFFEREDYIYGNFNFGVEQAQTDWIVRIDSDEVISPALAKSIRAVLEAGSDATHKCYTAEAHLYMFGYRMQYGWGAKSRRPTLFRKGVAQYRVRSEHEELQSEHPWGHLEGHYDHFTSPTLGDLTTKINYYTDKDAARSTPGRVRGPVAMLWNVLHWWLRFYFYPYRSYRDGLPGFAVSVIGAFSIILLDLKMWEKAQRDRNRDGG